MTIQEERQHRLTLWNELKAMPPAAVTPGYLREKGIYGGMQGIWVDKARTGSLTSDAAGATVSILHTGRHYADDLTDEGIIYHYPRTTRPASRDAGEVQATKNAAAASLPVFVISPGQRTAQRHVRLSWVVDHDDINRQFLILFGDQSPNYREPAQANAPFDLFAPTSTKSTLVKTRPGQQRFRFQVLKRYGAKCAVCNIRHQTLLKAAHICGKAEQGADDWRNGLPLCATHHDAFDAFFFGIEPDTLRLVAAPGISFASIGIIADTLTPLTGGPHPEAIKWRWTTTSAKWS